ncbi:hypothetical protein [Nostoc sp.]|uniref:hypothetical protein n=1 Tax=Nostoc sp. TaxID=1180 RepID=UPI002FFA83C0
MPSRRQSFLEVGVPMITRGVHDNYIRLGIYFFAKYADPGFLQFSLSRMLGKKNLKINRKYPEGALHFDIQKRFNARLTLEFRRLEYNEDPLRIAICT